MALIVVQADLENLYHYARAVQEFGTAKVRQYASWAMNQVGDKMRTRVQRQLATQSGLSYGEVAGEISTTRANVGRLIYSLDGSGNYFGVEHFAPSRRSNGVSARPWNRRITFADAFMAAGKVWIRQTPARYPLHHLMGPSIPREMEREDHGSLVPTIFDQEAQAELPAAIDRKLGQMLPW